MEKLKKKGEAQGLRKVVDALGKSPKDLADEEYKEASAAGRLTRIL